MKPKILTTKQIMDQLDALANSIEDTKQSLIRSHSFGQTHDRALWTMLDTSRTQLMTVCSLVSRWRSDVSLDEKISGKKEQRS